MTPTRRFIAYLKPHAARFAWAGGAMVAVSAFNGLSILFLKPIVDRIFIAKDLQMLWLAVLGDMGASVLVTINGMRLLAIRPTRVSKD